MSAPRFALLAMALFGAVACSRPKPEQQREEAPKAAALEPSHSDEAEHEELPKRIHVSQRIVDDAKIKTAPVVREPIAPTLTLPGEIASDPDKTGRISTPAAGRLVRIDFREGTVVKKGVVVGAVRVTDVAKVRSARNAAVAKGSAARSNATRLQELAATGLGSKQEALAAKADAEALEAEARGLGEELAVLGLGSGGTGSEIALRAPVGGVVLSREGVVGQPVSAEQTIGTIADLSEVWFLGRVFEKDLSRLSIGSRAEVQLNAHPDDRFEGTVEYIGQQLDPVARTVTARVRLTNRKNLLRIGLFGNARVSVAEPAPKRPVLVVPRSAVTDIGGKTVVFVRHADDDFELHDVTLGDSALGKVEVLNGLREGELVVTEGVFTLKSVVLKSTLAEDE